MMRRRYRCRARTQKEPWHHMGKAIDYDSFGVDDRPDRLSNVPDEALEALLEEERENPPKTWKEAWKRSIDWELEHGVRTVND